MTIIADPFANANATSASPLDFDDPSSDFVKVDDIDGRLVCIFAKEIRREASKTQAGKMYDKIVADVIVLDGPVTDKVTEVPMLIADMHLSATALVGALRNNVRTKRPVLGRIDSRPSKMNARVLAFGIQPATADEKMNAGPVVQSVLAANMGDPA